MKKARTKAFPNGRSAAVRIPAEFGIRPGDDLLVEQGTDGSVRISRAQGMARFLAVMHRVGPAREGELDIPRLGPPRSVKL